MNGPIYLKISKHEHCELTRNLEGGVAEWRLGQGPGDQKLKKKNILGRLLGEKKLNQGRCR